MTQISIAHAVQIQNELAELNPPPSVRRAVADITTLAAAGGRVPVDLMQYVTRWVARRGGQDRYGKARV